MTDRRVLAAGVILTAVVAGVVARAGAADNHSELARTLSRAIAVDQALATSASDVGLPGSGASPDTVRAMLHQYFTGRALQVELARLEAAGKPRPAPDAVALGGGVRAFSVTRSSRPNDHTAVLRGTATAWARVGEVQADRVVTSTPSNEMVVSATLDRDAAGVWRVSELSWTFAPGSAP